MEVSSCDVISAVTSVVGVGHLDYIRTLCQQGLITQEGLGKPRGPEVQSFLLI